MSVFNINIDFNKSKGSYIFDKTTNKQYLDFMGMYSSLAIGYNHSIFGSEYLQEIGNASKQKIVNCEVLSDQYTSFFTEFKEFTSTKLDVNYAFTCTGALANEAAIKTAMWYKTPNPKGYILSIKNSFHGINSVGNIITTRFKGIHERLECLPGQNMWPQVDNINDAINHIKGNNPNLQGVIIEPIQATFGDNYLNIDELKMLRRVCTEWDIPLIFDEVQTGFGSSGKVWYSDLISVSPDILVFGKKSQVSGIIVQKSHSKIFDLPKRLSVTFDGDLLDMIRCKYIISAIKQDKLLDNSTRMGKLLAENIPQSNNITDIRQTGVLLAIDFVNKSYRDRFVKKLYKNSMMCNPTGERTIRLRPNLAVTKDEIDTALSIIHDSVGSLK
jgi:L-lysine 6-transaminase|tara:strand:- start:9842 stop:10999 length:1158 start_codon:yes stop_codon:yes gene_type:complete